MRPVLYRVIFKIFRSFDQITTLTYILMNNFCPCFKLQGPYQDRELVLQVLDTDDGPYDDRVGEVTNTGGPRKSV